MSPVVVAFADLPAMAGRDLGVSDWLSLDQPRINRFADATDATDDHQLIHVDVERAMREQGGPIAHGFLTLSLLPRLQDDLFRIEGADKVLNVGVNWRARAPASDRGGGRTARRRLADYQRLPDRGRGPGEAALRRPERDVGPALIRRCDSSGGLISKVT